jgi:hypothetical protein
LKVCRNANSWIFLHAGDADENTIKYIFFLEIIYVILTTVMKASLAVSLLQWAKKKAHIYLLWLAIALDVAICTFVVLYFLLECKPISYKWLFINPIVKGKCLPASGEILVGFALCSVTISVSSGKEPLYYSTGCHAQTMLRFLQNNLFVKKLLTNSLPRSICYSYSSPSSCSAVVE